MKMAYSVGRLCILFFITLLITTFFAANETAAWENGINRPGSDIPGAAFWVNKNVEAFTAVQKCADACKKRQDCRCFTWVKPGIQGADSRCWLKNSIPAPAKKEWCISGLIRPVSAAWKYGINRPGSDIPGAAFWINKNVEAFTAVQKCADACKKRQDCRCFTWVKPGIQGADSRCW
ncbi:MAG: PAN domain-containing protein, partial [Desulfobacterales bacterium]